MLGIKIVILVVHSFDQGFRTIMAAYADLELGLHRRDADAYAVEFSISRPDSEADVGSGQGQPTAVKLPLAEFQAVRYDPDLYGEKLTQALFGDPEVRRVFDEALASVEAHDASLRIRLKIGPSAPELHAVHWETLRDPRHYGRLATNQNILFSRYLSTWEWRPVRLRAKAELRCLAVIANPVDLGEYGLAPIDAVGERDRTEQSLGDIPLTALGTPDSGKPASLRAMISELSTGTYDILSLICHGSMVDNVPWLWLENDENQVGRISGQELTERLRELVERPRLIVLASCESAGGGSGDALAALGPLLAEAGIPAVLAMQGQISMPTVAAFMPVFFEELRRDGQIDRALAVARGAVAEHSDYWMPALFMRLKSGRIWYVPGFDSPEHEADIKWESLASFVQDGNSTPILGPGVWETLTGSRVDLAIRWARQHNFPLAPSDFEVLPRVAQYLLTHQSQAFLWRAAGEGIRDGLLLRYGDVLPPELAEAPRWSTQQLEQAIGHAFENLWSSGNDGPYQMLARLPLPIYITTERYTNLTTRALRKAGKEPQERIARWNDNIPLERAVFEEVPTPDRPLVYYLLGHISVPRSVVMAEDHYFDYLIGMTRNRGDIPSALRRQLVDSALLFLGFSLNDWELRTFFRLLLKQEGSELLDDYTHAAVQVEPDEDRIVDLERARKYFSEYFEVERIGAFWGSSEDFLSELSKRMAVSAGKEQTGYSDQAERWPPLRR